MEMKGFVFTLDALLSITIAIIIVTAIFLMLPKTREDYFARSQLSSFANDLLIVFDKNETLDALDDDKITDALQEILPDNYAAEIKIFSYELDQDEFVLDETVISKYPNVQTPDEFVKAKRGFLTFKVEGDVIRIDKYNIAEIRLWLR